LMLRVLLKKQMLRAMVFSLLLAVLVTIAGNASARVAALPGESTEWPAETYRGPGLELTVTSPSTIGEAAPTSGNWRPVVRVWRAWDDALAVSVDGDYAFHLQGAYTRAAPRVVWDGSAIIIIHTGTDGHVYESRNGTEVFSPGGFLKLE
jgi:hypothetical protein